MKRVVTDTNILISALFWKGKPLQVINVFVDKRATLVLSEDIMSELTRKLHHKKFAAEIEESRLTIEAIVTRFRNLSEIILPEEMPENTVRDPKDQMILACALGGKADIIVSGDKDLLVLKSYQDISIVTPSEFLEISLA